MLNNKHLILVLLSATVLSATFSTSAASHIIIQAADAQNKTSTEPITTTIDYRQYDNSTLGIKIQVPADWLYKEINNTAVAFVTAPNNINRAAVVVEKENVPKGMSLGVFTQGNLNDL